MRKKIRYAFTILLSVLLLIQFLGIYQTTPNIVEEDETDLSKAMVYDFSSDPNELMNRENINILDQYDSFTVLETDQHGIESIKDQGYIVETLDEGNRPTWISGDSFEKVQTTLDSDVEDGLFVIEFIGPLKQNWREELEKEGFRFYERIRGFSYLVEYNGSDLNRYTNRYFIESYTNYAPEFKVQEGLVPYLDGEKSRVMIDIKMTSSSDANSLRDRFEPLDIELISFREGTLGYNSATIELCSSKLRYVLRDSEVLKISENLQYELMNDDASWVVQSFDTADNSRTIWDKGIYGQDQIVGIADTGIDYDHAMFRHAENEVGTPGEDHRKVVHYEEYADHKDTAYSGHGTHVTGSAVGDWENYGEPDGYDGMAPAARVAFFDIGEDGDVLKIPDDLNDLFQVQYDAGARIFSNSWGSSASYYTSSSQECDEFMWNNNDALILFANGNFGPENNTVASPASAKNIVSVGNSINDASEDMASSSSRGPTDEWRLKPTIVAPGTSILSADSDGDLTTMNDGLTTMTGTSMATPIVAGSTALIRQYYMDGWYPSGVQEEEDGFVPSGSLLKATLINSAWDMDGEYTGGPIPSHGQGWGKINLEDALYFEGDSTKLEILNNGSAEAISDSGEVHEYEMYVEDGQDLKLTLAWTDYPGSSLQNDLNLLVEDPEGNTFKGNVFSGGYSESGGSFDDNNVSEQVLLRDTDIKEGKYTVRVIGESISVAPQRYSLIATGEVSRSVESISFEYDKYNIYPVTESIGVRLQSPSSNEDPNQIESQTVIVTSTSDPNGESLTLSETDVDSGIFTGDMPITNEDDKEGQLQVKNGDVVEVEFEYEDSEMLTATARIRSDPPELVRLDPPSRVDNTLLPHTVEISWMASERSSVDLHYGKNRRLDNTVTHDFSSYNGSIVLEDLEPGTRYYYKFVFVDECEKSNVALEDDDGALFTFKTPEWPTVIGEGYSGHVQSISSNTDSVFDEDFMYSGYYYRETIFGVQEGPFYSAIMFESEDISDLDISSASLHLTPKSRYCAAEENDVWKFEVLEDTVENAFPDPSYSQINNADTLFTIGEFNSSELAGVDGVDVLDIPDEHLDLLEENLEDGRLVVRIRGPEGIEYTNVRSWYSGHQISFEEDLFNAPQLRINDFEHEVGKLRLDKGSYSDDDFVHVELIYDDEEFMDDSVDSVNVTVSSGLDAEELELLETGPETRFFTGYIELNSEDGLDVDDGDTLNVEYVNHDSEILTDTGSIDVDPPTIYDKNIEVRNDLSAVISWKTDEPATSTISYGGTEPLAGEEHDPQLKTEHELRLTGLSEDMDYFYDIISTDEAGNSEVLDSDGTSFSFTTPSSDIQPSIIVIEDAGDASNYKGSLDQLDLNYDFESIASDELPSSNLNHYDIVIWVVGGFTHTLTLRERQLVADYLENGGNLYLNGEDIGYDIGETTFYREYLHSNFLKPNGDGEKISGFQSDPISDGLDDLSIGGTYPDVIAPADSHAAPLFYYDTGDNASIRVETEDYKVVYMACEFFEGPETQETKTDLMSNIIDWFDPLETDDMGPSIGLIEEYKEVDWSDELEFDTVVDGSIARGSAIERAEFYVNIVCEEDDGSCLEFSENLGDDFMAEYTVTLDTSELSYGVHFLHIRGQDVNGNWGDFASLKFEVVENESSELKTSSLDLVIDEENDGWNFISSTLLPKEEDFISIVDDGTDGMMDSLKKVMYYDAEHDVWRSYVPGRAEHFNDDISFDHTMGIWVQVDDDCELVISGYEPDDTKIDLYPGWNMVGYPSSRSQQAQEVLPDEVNKIGVFNSNKEHNIEYTSDLSLELIPGQGYWIHNDADHVVEYYVEY